MLSSSIHAIAKGISSFFLSAAWIELKTKAIVRDNKGHYIMIKGTIQQEDITLVNI